ncbi:MAG TPA: hypothetical protein VGJ13_05160 [Pseudonocardiaceae bacterium]|jgi:hypothetical protein
MSTDPRLLLARLRTELTDLASALGPYAPPLKPDRFERSNRQKLGAEWHVPKEDRGGAPLLVRTLDEEPGIVFYEGASFQHKGDMEAVGTTEGRAFAMALLAACDWADGKEALDTRRVDKQASGE